MRALVILVGSVAVLAWSNACGAEDKAPAVRDVIGATHAGGKYCLTKQDYLNEGADKLLELGTRVIKLWFSPKPADSYPFNSQWPKLGSMVEIAKSKYFRDLFSKPFTTYILVAYNPGKNEHYYLQGMTRDDIDREKRAMHDLTKYLLTEYRGTGKTFVIQNWESDWALTNPESMREPGAVAIKGMTEWLNARQDGVTQAREEVDSAKVTVVHAAEVNLVAKAMEGKAFSTNSVIPHTHCDLYSYSAWDTSLGDQTKFRAALEYLKEKAPDSKLYGANNIYVGEYGAPENGVGGPDAQLKVVKAATETALSFGVRYLVYWELYCNESVVRGGAQPISNSACRGFWLIRPDGTKSKVWDYLSQLMKS